MKKVTELFQKLCFRLRHQKLGSRLRVLRNQLMGMRIGGGTSLCAGFHASWPQNVAIGSNCVVEPNVTFKVDSRWSLEKRVLIGDSVFIGAGSEFNISQRITVGNRCLIASGCKFVDHDHGFELSGPIHSQPGGEVSPISIGDDVWLGANVIVLRGVKIESGSIVGAGAVVTKSIPPNQIWAGVPARKIGERPANASANGNASFIC